MAHGPHYDAVPRGLVTYSLSRDAFSTDYHAEPNYRGANRNEINTRYRLAWETFPEKSHPLKKCFSFRTRRHEGILGALKKGNYLLKANIDRVKDDLSKHREMSLMLQEDLNSVLAELG